VAYNVSAIIHVGEAGLEYVDEYGDMRFVDFEVCSQNAAQYIQYATTPQVVARRRAARGWPGSSVLYIEFFTRPLIQFAFETEHDFLLLCWRLDQVGWKTLDLAASQHEG
jgi:hypothetical protein